MFMFIFGKLYVLPWGQMSYWGTLSFAPNGDFFSYQMEPHANLPLMFSGSDFCAALSGIGTPKGFGLQKVEQELSSVLALIISFYPEPSGGIGTP
jgi:hypothetical protein